MNTDIQNKDCNFGGDMLSYLYKEAEAGSYTAFEAHLQECESCIDEFAMLSDARFSVLEWERAEFAHLPNPSIVIPYEAVEGRSDGWIGAFWESLRMPVFSFGIAAAVILAGALALYFLLPVSSGPEMAEVAPITDGQPSTPSTSLSIPGSQTIVKENVIEPRPALIGTKANRVTILNRRPMVAAVTAKLPVRGSAKLPKVDQAVSKPMTQTAFKDEEDTSLRLADLLDEGGI